jgi:tRNA(Ile)-lysidine synthase
LDYSQNIGETNSSDIIKGFENKTAVVLKDCPSQAVFLAAVSGGADSMAMLVSLISIIPQERLFCLHIEHGLRTVNESKGDAEFVRDFCGKHEINFILKSIAPGKIVSFSLRKGTGIEAAARFFRRKALLKEAARLGENTIILTAHTKDDSLELALMRVLRGAGPAGLAAMPVRKEKFCRPLLSVSRSEVTGYLKEKKIAWREDSTNNDEKFFRNRIRRKFVPLLNELFPFWEKSLAAMAETQAYAAFFIIDEAQRRINWEWQGCNLVTGSDIFFSQPQIIREEALFRGIDLALAGKSIVSIKRASIRRFCASVSKTVDLRFLQIKHENEKVILRSARNNLCETGFSLLIKEPGLYNLNRIGIEVTPYSTESEDVKQGFASFYTCLPLVFRPCFKDDFPVNNEKKTVRRKLGRKVISVADKFGTAAFICNTEIIFGRDINFDKVNEKVFTIRLFKNSGF